MDTKKKQYAREVIYLVLIFLFFYVFARVAVFLSAHYDAPLDIMILLFALVMTGTVYLLARLYKDTKDNFHFQVTPEKLCQDPYTYSSDPEKKAFCKQFTPAQIAEYTCGKGFVGAPVHWQRSTDSNANWENTTCDSGLDDYSYPQPL